jgi:hypothetical protein
MIASCSPDDIVKIMDVSHFEERPKDGSFNLEAYEAALDHKPNHGKNETIKAAKEKVDSDEWSDDSDDSGSKDSDSDDSDDSMNEEDNLKHKKKNKKLNPKSNSVGLSKKML